MGGAHGTTDQWLRKTCCLVTGCGVIRHSSGYFGYFPGGSDGKASAYNVGDLGSIPGSGRSPGEGSGNPIPVFLPGKSHEQRSLVGYSPWGRKESDTTSDFTFTLRYI